MAGRNGLVISFKYFADSYALELSQNIHNTVWLLPFCSCDLLQECFVWSIGVLLYTKRSVRSVLCCLSRVPGLRTCLLRKISNSEAHADMNTIPLTEKQTECAMASATPKGDAYKHIPRTSTVASPLLRVRSVRSSELSDERSSKRLST